MKFLVETLSKCGPRLGTLKEGEQRLETPMAMLYTRGGSIPHITQEVFKLVCNSPQVILLPVVSICHYREALTHFEGSLSKFVGLEDCMSCMMVQDPGDFTQPGRQMKGKIPIWTRSGKILLSASSYMDMVEAFKPDMYYLLSDGDTNIASSSKRVTKSVDNTINFFNQCLERHKASEVLKNTFVMAAIAGGYCLQARTRCIDNIGNNEAIGGFLIDGLHNNGPEVEFLPFAEIKPVIQHAVSTIPADKLRVVYGCWNPVAILQMIQLGVDVFDTSYCYIVTERSSALTFSLEEDNTIYEINLRNEKFADDFQPLSENCKCLACTKHTRAYIHHLVAVQEMLGALLLTIHNVHHYMRFFEKIREHIKNGTLDELQKIVAKQFNDFEELMTGAR